MRAMVDRIAITGAAGFIGSALAARLVAEGAVVHALVRPGTAIHRLVPGTTVHRLDLSDHSAVRQTLAEISPTIIYHLATSTGRTSAPDLANDRVTVVRDLDVLLGLLSAAAALPAPPRSFVRAGTLAEYGDGPIPSREGQRERPKSAYAGTMVAASQLAAAIGRHLPFPVRTARLALTYGPHQATTYLIPWLIERCLAGEPAFIRFPEQRRDLIYVEDVVGGLIAMARSDHPAAGLVNLSTGIAPTMAEAAELVARCCGSDPQLIRIADDRSAWGADMAPQVVLGDTARALATLSWRACYSLEAGLRRTIDALRNEKVAA